MKGKKPAKRIPLQITPTEDLRAKLQRIAEANSLSLNDVANLTFAAGIGIVEEKLGELQPKEAA